MARKCLQLHERAHMAPPEPLRRLLGIEHLEAATPARLTAQIPPPHKNRPQRANSEWIWIPAKDAAPTSLLPAVLLASPEPMSAGEAIDGVLNLAPTLIKGSIYNSGTRLQKEGIIDRKAGLWHVIKPERVGVIDDGLLWGHPSMFGKEELAIHRREAILHILRHFQMGLQIVQLVEQLRNCSWMKAPANKDLLKADVKILEKEGKIRRRGGSNKWELTPAEKGEIKA